jgi:hypothetical protein
MKNNNKNLILWYLYMNHIIQNLKKYIIGVNYGIS